MDKQITKEEWMAMDRETMEKNWEEMRKNPPPVFNLGMVPLPIEDPIKLYQTLWPDMVMSPEQEKQLREMWEQYSNGSLPRLNCRCSRVVLSPPSSGMTVEQSMRFMDVVEPDIVVEPK